MAGPGCHAEGLEAAFGNRVSLTSWGSLHGHPMTAPPSSSGHNRQPSALLSLRECPPTLVPCFLPTADSPGVVPGIIGAVVMAVAGAISSFIAYQKKKLCFKQNGKVSTPAAFPSCLANLKLGLFLQRSNLKSRTQVGGKHL